MSDSARATLLQAVDARLWAAFNAITGTVEKYLRKHRVGPLKPMNKQRPQMTVSDNGTRRAAPNDNESAGEVLGVRVTLHICDTWEREDTGTEWTNRVEAIKAKLRGRPAGAGALDCTVVRDDPLDLATMSGAMEGVWIIDLEIPYAVEADELTDWA